MEYTADSQRTVLVNDGERGTTPFTFEFGPHWVHEGNLPDRFFGGDEHWVTNVQFGTDWPWVVFRFVGTAVTLYGHKVPMGGMADVTVDGSPAGRIDFYHPERVEKAPLYTVSGLTGGEHTLRVQLIPDKNPQAGDTHEAAFDYAEVVTAAVLPVTGIGVSRKALMLEPGLTASFTVSLLPSYANEAVVLSCTASDGTVTAKLADGVCTVTALNAGQSDVVLKTDTGLEAIVPVTVREPLVRGLSGMAGRIGHHTQRDTYLERLAAWNPGDNTLSAVLWCKDRAAVKIDLITGPDAAHGVTVTAGPPTNSKGDVLAASVDCRFLRESLAYDTKHLIPDVIWENGPEDVPAQSLASVWVALETAADAQPGTYTTDVTVTAQEGVRLVFPLTVTVIGLTLPDARPELELWQYPYSSNRYYSGLSTADCFPDGRAGMYRTRMVLDGRLGEGLASQVELYAKAGGKSVTTTVVEDPWNSQTPDPFPSMVKWIKKPDGSFAFDYTDFDAWVVFNEQRGVDGRILCFSLSGWGSGITYLDEASGEIVTDNPQPNTPAWQAVWTQFLTNFMAHTEAKGWFSRVCLAMDERPAPMVEGVLDVVESVRNADGECFRVALAVYTFDTEYLFDRIYDLALAYYMNPTKVSAITAHRRELGLVTTLYTCGPQYNALENPPYEGLYTLWFCDKMGADGFLRWAQDAFNDDPLRSSYHLPFAAGDIYLFYPDEKDAAHPHAHSSARFETLAQSARDVAKLRYLREVSPESLIAVTLAEARLTGHGDLETPIASLRRLLDEAAMKVSLGMV